MRLICRSQLFFVYYMRLFKKPDHRTDEELLAAYREKGDMRLIGDLYTRYSKKVFGACLFYFRDRHQSADAVMAIFEKLIAVLRTQEVQSFKGWLSFVVRNHCISELRKKKSGRLLPESYLEFEIIETDATTEQHLALVAHDQLLEHLQEALPTLPETQRTCVDLFYLQNKSYQEIAAVTGYTDGAVRSYIQNGKRNLKLYILKKRGHEKQD